MRDGERHLELIGGRVRERFKSMAAAYVSGQVLFRLHQLADETGGVALGWSLGYVCFPEPNDVRRVSVTYLSAERIPPGLFDTDHAFMPIAPDLAADTRAMGPTPMRGSRQG
jgi:hypothetical protein